MSCGICTISPQAGEEWIICPRRLFSISAERGISQSHQPIWNLIKREMGYGTDVRFGLWIEPSVSAKVEGRRFNYRLDYLLRRFDGAQYHEPLIIEVMTCSTSGGNKAFGTDIRTAFTKAILNGNQQDTLSPGVNVRQVWARMASQLIVKSELALAWGGRAVWLVQDQLLSYIDNQTGLRISTMKSKALSEVNIISVSASGGDPQLYAGPIADDPNGRPGFLNILRAPVLPHKAQLDLMGKTRTVDSITL